MKTLPSLLAVLALLSGCSRPEPLLLGEVALPYEIVDQATKDLQVAYPNFGKETLQNHLLQFGLAQGALLHAALPAESEAAAAKAQAYADALEDGEPFLLAFHRWCEAENMPKEADASAKPHPSDLGAAAAAAVAVLEPGSWTGPLRTLYGWEILYLDHRDPDVPRNRAHVTLYRLQFPIGTAEDHQRVEQTWATLTFGGNPELIQALPPSMRQGRVQQDPTE
ncbi:MAG: peptidyl-prolyl cis-trans isomerase [Planctomycetota bacterium]